MSKSATVARGCITRSPARHRLSTSARRSPTLEDLAGQNAFRISTSWRNATACNPRTRLSRTPIHDHRLGSPGSEMEEVSDERDETVPPPSGSRGGGQCYRHHPESHVRQGYSTAHFSFLGVREHRESQHGPANPAHRGDTRGRVCAAVNRYLRHRRRRGAR